MRTSHQSIGGLRGDALIIAMADSVVFSNPQMDAWGRAVAIFNLYTKFRAKYPDEPDFKERYEEIEKIETETAGGLEELGFHNAIPDAAPQVPEINQAHFTRLNRAYALISSMIVESGILQDATIRVYDTP
jgi:hypothetical protein